MAICGATICLLAVAIGAFGAHALKDVLIANQRESVFELANRYQFYHGLGLLLMAALFQHNQGSRSLSLINALIVVGTVIFSGSLYTLAITNIAWLGAITPVGGSALIAAWALSIWRIFSEP